MSNEATESIERNIREAKKVVEFGNALERLTSNRDFKKVILEGYFEKEAVRLVHLKADPSMQSAESQKSILTQIDAIGAVTQFLNTAMHMSRLAQKSIGDDEEMLAELLKEGAAE